MESIQLLHAFCEALNPQLGKRMKLTALLARQVAQGFDFTPDQLEQIEMAGMIHDIGLLGLPKELQNKDVKLLSEAQYREYCEHPITAAISLESIQNMGKAQEMILHHHERMNGEGFPNGLSGNEIPLGARIIAVVSDYCLVLATWPRELQKIINFARRYLPPEDWQKFTYADAPQDIVEECAVKLLLKDPDEKYDTRVVNRLIKIIYKKKNMDPVYMVGMDRLKPGMVLMEDLRTTTGRLLLTKGNALNASSIQSLESVQAQGLIPEKIYVTVPGG